MGNDLHRPGRPLAASEKLQVFLAGLRLGILGDRSVLIQVVLALIVLGVVFWLRTWLDFILILVVTGFMLCAEFFNTVVERLCDYIQPESDPKIGVIKDIAAAGSGIAILMWIATLVFEFGRIWTLFR